MSAGVKFRFRAEAALWSSTMLAEALIRLATDIGDHLRDGQIVELATLQDELRAAASTAEDEQRRLLEVARAFLNAGFPER